MTREKGEESTGFPRVGLLITHTFFQNDPQEILLIPKNGKNLLTGGRDPCYKQTNLQ